ncbi:hypothetical protein A1Q1_05990 [Trichosporon asahii var. asahii CBS 2479]|uniref:Uncharacterized protein n=1 Tax=Trichosporon asahii var. asahii (strain ATCC 90039 / CBS 2479 / JCM 2466 / KCTC 7840 / NBRC 103889/ NCYC 2677 / UAMH 7654) TaxID=1186058 RepID=J6EMM1_TRIAS|nr:hypothetical protein A1Q1_05990 [Trichosporon asahii var. asahii CBS 2479]EJT45544.1 hypothetical protein A1Q1_05990 [Trichosporon asahii var. asahii CBS 2479]
MRLLLGLYLASPALGAAFTSLQLSGSDGPWCVQTKGDSTEIGTPLEYGKCGPAPTQRWSYVENQLRLSGEVDRCIGLKQGAEAPEAVLASCIPTDDPTVETSWTWDTTKRSQICTYHEKTTTPQQTWCLSAIGGQEPPRLFLSWRQRAGRFEPQRTPGGPVTDEEGKCGAASGDEANAVTSGAVMVCAMPVPNGMQGRNARAVSRSPAQRMAVPGRYLTYTDRLGPTDPEPPTRSITTSTYHENMFDPKRPQIFGTVPPVVAGEPKHSPAAPSITRPAPTTSWLSMMLSGQPGK